jgi:hypothetical protein
VLDPEKINPWLATAEEEAVWEAHIAKKLAIERASPAYQAREKNNRILCGVVAEMLYPRGPFCIDPLYDDDGYIRSRTPSDKPMQKGEYPWDMDRALFGALGLYCRVFRETRQYNTEQEEERLCNMPSYSRNLILESCKIAKWPYKLGAALYLHQQMVVRRKDKEPSQGKAQWLVAKAPVKPIERGGRIPLRPDGGEPGRIGDQWPKYFSVAHYWAAFVVWTKAPLDYPVDRYALIDFVCNADPDDFLAQAAAFKKFRVDLPIERTKLLPLIKMDANRSDVWLDDIVPTSQLSIPDLLAPYQWDALREYGTRPRPNRSTKSQRS